MSLYRFYLFLISFSLSISSIVLPMEQEIEEITQGIAQLGGLGGSKKRIKIRIFDSDSEDEENYTYPGLPHLTISDDKQGKECIVLSRGIHFSPSRFGRRKRSQMRKANDAGKEIFSSAAYDLAGESLDAENKEEVREKAIGIRDQIKQLKPKERNIFQQIYSNQYDGFHKRLGTDRDGGIFKQFESDKNPQISTSEDFVHAGKYASGYKSLGEGIKALNPKYGMSGKPRHPYLGKLFAFLISSDQIDEVAPYFVVHGHANDDITISDHFSKNLLSEREVSIPGLIPGNCVVFSVPLRVPSFKGGYKSWYEEKFGISKQSYMVRKKKLADGNTDTIKNLLMNVILPHMAQKMKEHIIKECAEKNIRLVYKQFDGSLKPGLPSLVNATDHKKSIKQQKI